MVIQICGQDHCPPQLRRFQWLPMCLFSQRYNQDFYCRGWCTHGQCFPFLEGTTSISILLKEASRGKGGGIILGSCRQSTQCANKQKHKNALSLSLSLTDSQYSNGENGNKYWRCSFFNKCKGIHMQIQIYTFSQKITFLNNWLRNNDF